MKILRAIWAAISRRVSRMHHAEARNARRRERFLRVNNYQFAIRKWFAAAATERRERQRRTP